MNKEVGETKQYVKTMAQMKLACAGVTFFCVEGRHSSAEEQQRWENKCFLTESES